MSESNDTPNIDSSDSDKECLFCKNKNPMDYQYCVSCGSSLIYKNCANCRFTVPIDSRFCPNCGIDIQNTNVIPYRNILSYIPPQPAYYPSYTYNYYYQKPKWWNLPVFFMIFGIFGLLMLSSMAVVIIVASIGLTTFTFPETIYLDMATKLFQLLLIFIAIKYFRGLKTFFTKRTTDKTNSSEQDTVTTSLPVKPKVFTKALFVLLFVFIILVVDLYTSLIVTVLQGFLHTGNTSSAYSFLDNNINQYFLLIVFWVVIFAPIHEEILFRGILQQGLDRSVTSNFSHYIIQGVTFAFMHLAGDVLMGGSFDFVILHMISTFTFAICSTYLRKKFHSLLPSIFLHALSNGLSLSFDFISTPYFTADQVNLISNLIYIIPILLILAILGLLFLLHQWKPKKPESLQEIKNINFIFKALIIALIFNVSQYFYIVLPTSQQFIFIILVTIASLAIFIYWGKKIRDIPWSKFEPPLKKGTQDIPIEHDMQ